MLTDSDDTEMFDQSEEERDADTRADSTPATTNEDDSHGRNEREGTPGPGQQNSDQSQPSTTFDSSHVEKTKSPESYMNHSAEIGTSTKPTNPPQGH